MGKKGGDRTPDGNGGMTAGSNILIEDSLTSNDTRAFFEFLKGDIDDLVVVATNVPGEKVTDVYDEVMDNGGQGRLRVIDACGDASGERIVNISSVEDLTTVGVKISNSLERYEETESRTVCLCIDSISPVLTLTETQTVFRFLHVVTGQVGNVDGVGIVGVRPAVHDRQELATIEQLFDGRIARQDGSLEFTSGGFNSPE